MLNYTVALQFIMALVSSIAALGLFVSYWKKDVHKGELTKLGLFFTLFAAYSFAQSLPFLIVGTLEYVAWGFILSVYLVLVMVLVLFETKVFYLNPLIKRIRPFFRLLVVVSGVFIMALLITDFRLPILDESGWILWNVNPLAIWAFSLITGFTALLWSFAYFDSARFTESLVARVKAYILSLNGIIWALAVVLYFPSADPSQISFAIIITLISLILSALVFWVPRFLPNNLE
ncbi:hypothetical protein CL654_02440 [bacterium]|nr:hypothetical protein [bacterium]|tara:strand:- start:3197 stop:3895 length:699 start_codon:yes stop_codon:yes gene_type:complete